MNALIPAATLENLLRERVAADPSSTAIVDDNDQSYTYEQFDKLASRLANALIADGIGVGDRVAICADNCLEFLVALFGIAKSGAIAVTVNYRLAPTEVEYILGDAEPQVVILGPGYESLTPTAHNAGVSRVITAREHPDSTTWSTWLEAADDTDPLLSRDTDATAMIMYSSGTTGRPKGIEIAGRGIARCIQTLYGTYRVGPTSRALIAGPFFHIGGLALVLVSLRAGAALLLHRYATPGELLRTLEQQRVTHTGAVPSLIQFMLADPFASTGDWSALEMLSYGASPIPEPTLREATATLGCGFLQTYGLTETTGSISVLDEQDHHITAETAHRLRSVGRAAPGVDLKIMDPETLQEVAAGEKGEVWARGDGVMNRYWRNEAATASTVLDGWLRTGDIGSLDADGYLYLHDRLKDMIVSGGENVYPAEVESIMTAHPEVAQIAVIGVPSQRWGETAHAVVVRTANSQLQADELIAWARDQMAHYKVPSSVTFVDELPVTGTGKINKVALRADYR